jgi:hypothetical protein
VIQISTLALSGTFLNKRVAFHGHKAQLPAFGQVAAVKGFRHGCPPHAPASGQ